MGLNLRSTSKIRSMTNKPLQLGETVYHRTVYNHREPLKVLGITETEVLLEGDYSGGTHGTRGKDWLPIKGTSRIFNHAQKAEFRKQASDIEILAYPCAGSKDTAYLAMMDMVHAVKVLTTDITYNPEF